MEKTRLLTRRGMLQLALGASAGVTLSKPSAAAARSGYRIPQLARKPPLGWNSFNSYGVYLHEEAAAANLEAMAEKLKPVGYEYFVIDNGWFGEYKLVRGTKYPAEKHASDLRINEYGLIQPSKTYFPNGLKRLAGRAHELGLKFGVHLMRGIPRKAVEENLPVQGTKYRARDIADTGSICRWCHYNYGVDMSRPGAQAFYNSLINQLAGWGIDFIKADDLVPFPAEILGFANAIEQCGRDIVFSLSPGGMTNMAHLPYYRRANMVRTTGDVWDRRSDLNKGFDAWKQWQGTAYPGFWPDLDMIPFGQLLLMSPKEHAEEGSASLAGHGYKRQCEYTRDQQYTFITQRALSASPLMVGGDIPTMDEFSLELQTNAGMLECNQNGVMGRNVCEENGIEVWLTPKADRPGEGWFGVFNRNESERKVTLSPAGVGLSAEATYAARDVWTERNFLLRKPGHTFEIAADGVAFVKYTFAC